MARELTNGAEQSFRNFSSASNDPLPAPLVAADVDLRGSPIPKEFFAQLAVTEFGVSIEEARAFVDQAANRMEVATLKKTKPRRSPS
jgi:hypothetical protein